MTDETSTPAHLRPVQPWSYSRSSTTPRPSSPSATATGMPPHESSSSPEAVGRDGAIATWIQACVALVPPIITLLVAFGMDMSNEQQLAATGVATAAGGFALITWRTFRKKGGGGGT